jgi:hypothetical protein
VFVETRRDVAQALARLGSQEGITSLLDGLDHPDELIRESMFEAFFGATGKHLCYDPLAPRDDRLAAIANLRAWWAKDGGDQALRVRRVVRTPKIDAEVWRLVGAFAGGDGSTPPGDDQKIRARFLELGGARGADADVRLQVPRPASRRSGRRSAACSGRSRRRTPCRA